MISTEELDSYLAEEGVDEVELQRILKKKYKLEIDVQQLIEDFKNE